jgi:hypothetical protein
MPSPVRFDLWDAMDILDPNTNKTLFNVWAASGPGGATVGVLGSGSDYAPFLHHVGVSSMDLRFTGAYGVYHSVYDSFYWMSHFGDPQFLYHRAMAQYWGLIGLRMASARCIALASTGDGSSAAFRSAIWSQEFQAARGRSAPRAPGCHTPTQQEEMLLEYRRAARLLLVSARQAAKKGPCQRKAPRNRGKGQSRGRAAEEAADAEAERPAAAAEGRQTHRWDAIGGGHQWV